MAPSSQWLLPAEQPPAAQAERQPHPGRRGLFFPAIHFAFETETGKLGRIEGRVPPKVRSGDRWKDFDARVEYRFQAASYR